MKATVTITEQELEALDRLIRTGAAVVDGWQGEYSPEIHTAHEWLTFARRALDVDQKQGDQG